MNPQHKAKTDYEKELAIELKNVKQQLADMRRQLTGLERDNRLLTVMSENADRLRRVNEADKKLYSLYSSTLLEHCPHHVFIFNPDLELQLASASCLSILHFESLDEMIDHGPGHVFGGKMDNAWIKKLEAQCREVMDGRTAVQYNDKIIFTDGAGYMETQSSIVPMVDEESGALHGVLVSLYDVTELLVTKDLAEEASRTKSSFLANMSHEIRTPMNTIKGLAELLMMTELNELQQAYVSNVVNSSNSLLAIISDILDFSKIDANKIDIMKSEYSLATLLKDVCSVVNLRAAEKDLAFAVEIDPALPDKLYGDDSRLKQVMLNVLGNAVKYTDQGKITFKVKGDFTEAKLINLRFSIKDTGLGIKHEEISTLFEAFGRADLRLSRGIMGTGLGLAISKNLMLAMEGDISVESIYGKGSTFSFWLPQLVVNPTPMALVEHPDKKKVLILDEDKRGKALAALLDKLDVPHVSLKETRDQAMHGWEDASHCIYYDGYDLSNLGKLRGSMPESAFVVIRDIHKAADKPKFADMTIYEPVLITDLSTVLNLNRKSGLTQNLPGVAEFSGNFKVRDASALAVDDNALNLMVSSEMLRSFGFDVVGASSGAEAIRACQEREFDIIFMDHMMPQMDGIEAAVHIREAPGKNLKTPVVVLTANVVSGMKDYFLRCGMDDMVSKPIDLVEISRAILTWVPQHKIVTDGGSAPTPAAGASMSPDFDLVGLLDEFGMYANDVMRELDGDLQTYIARLGQCGTQLGDIVRHLNELVRLEDWPRFSRVIGELKEMLHGVGARDCAVRAKKMEIASSEGNVSYVHQDFKSLMGNMYMLERKMDALVPLAMGNKKSGYKPNDPAQIYARLQDLQAALDNKKMEDACDAMEDLARWSFDHDLDMQLNAVRWAMEDGDFEDARKLNATAVAFYKKKNIIPGVRG